MYWIKERVSLDATYRNNYNNANILIYICSHILSVCCNLGLINIMHYGVFASLKIYFFECWCWSNTFVEKCNSFNFMKLLFIYTKGLFFCITSCNCHVVIFVTKTKLFFILWICWNMWYKLFLVRSINLF